MSQKPKITAIEPAYAIPGGEIAISCEGFDAGRDAAGGVFVGGERCTVIGASSRRILANVPVEIAGGESNVSLESRGATSESVPIIIGRLLTSDMHIVANPAVDPSDDA